MPNERRDAAAGGEVMKAQAGTGVVYSRAARCNEGTPGMFPQVFSGEFSTWRNVKECDPL